MRPCSSRKRSIFKCVSTDSETPASRSSAASSAASEVNAASTVSASGAASGASGCRSSASASNSPAAARKRVSSSSAPVSSITARSARISGPAASERVCMSCATAPIAAASDTRWAARIAFIENSRISSASSTTKSDRRSNDAASDACFASPALTPPSSSRSVITAAIAADAPLPPRRDLVHEARPRHRLEADAEHARRPRAA